MEFDVELTKTKSFSLPEFKQAGVEHLNFFLGPRRIYRGGDKIVSVSKCKNWFCSLLKCVSTIFILNIYVSDSTLSEDFRSTVSK